MLILMIDFRMMYLKPSFRSTKSVWMWCTIVCHWELWMLTPCLAMFLTTCKIVLLQLINYDVNLQNIFILMLETYNKILLLLDQNCACCCNSKDISFRFLGWFETWHGTFPNTFVVTNVVSYFGNELWIQRTCLSYVHQIWYLYILKIDFQL